MTLEDYLTAEITFWEINRSRDVWRKINFVLCLLITGFLFYRYIVSPFFKHNYDINWGDFIFCFVMMFGLQLPFFTNGEKNDFRADQITKYRTNPIYREDWAVTLTPDFYQVESNLHKVKIFWKGCVEWHQTATHICVTYRNGMESFAIPRRWLTDEEGKTFQLYLTNALGLAR